MEVRSFLSFLAQMLFAVRAHKIGPPISAPNIVLILGDDLGWGDHSASPWLDPARAIVPTPNILKLAARGLRFPYTYSATVCAPSRCTLMTGRHTGHCTVRGNDGSYTPLLGGEETLATVLSRAGYKTGLFGKWGLGDIGTSGYPMRQGFGTFIGQDSQVSCHNQWPATIQNDTEAACPVPENAAASTGTQCIEEGASCRWMHDIVTETGLAFIRKHAAKQSAPFFAFFSTTAPHTGGGLGEGVTSEWPTPFAYASMFAQEPWPSPQRDFAGQIAAVDRLVGKVLDSLTEMGIEEETLVVFMGDNGPDQDANIALFKDAGPFRGKKRSLHEGGVRQTMIASWPGAVAENASTDALFAFWDLLPTVAELAGAKVANPVDGVSLAPVLRGGRSAPAHNAAHPPLYWEYCWNKMLNGTLPQLYPVGWGQAVLLQRGGVPNRRWKAIRVDRSTDVLLFDLASDRSETTDLSASFPEIVAEAIYIMEEEHEETPTWPSAVSPGDGCCKACYKPQGCKAPCYLWPKGDGGADGD